jgi:protein phosphatase 2C family protein 2/3
MIKSGIDYNYSGTCVNLIFIKDDICTIANLGDSRAVLCRMSKDINAIELSWDHKPTRKTEKDRILVS